MNITFICGTLAPGKSGVGDYTLRLAAELIRQGHRASAVAVRDPFVTDMLEDRQADRTVPVPVLRFPADAGRRVQTGRIRSFLDQQGAEWLSLQYVPFSFHDRGLHGAWNGFFAEVGRGRHWQIMFHELWLGLNQGASIKEVWWGRAQRRCLLNLVGRLKPACVHTHAGVYRSVLSQNGIPARQLPLFPNIVPNPDAIPIDRRPDVITFAVFASIYPSAQLERFLDELEAENKRSNRSAHFVFLGRNGARKKQWIQAIEQKPTLTFEDRGVMEAAAIADQLSRADIGLSFTPLPLTEKSGTVACYWACGLPVLSLADEWHLRKKMEPASPRGIAAYQAGQLRHFLETYPRMKVKSKRLAEIAAQFVAQTAGAVNMTNYEANR